LMTNDDGGAIVITSSAAGLKSVAPTFRSGSHGAAGYVAAKHGVVGLMRHYARTLGERNIRVNSIHPGAVATPMTENEAVKGAFADFPEWIEYAQPLLPVSFLDPTAVSEAMVYLCGQAGRSITGVILPIDAGWTMK
jgi:NAD(P)-dependent dehydrogenase (short-subunit alcohol dehydrogenase family)